MQRPVGLSRIKTALILLITVISPVVVLLHSNKAYGDTTNEIYYSTPTKGECLKGGPGTSYTIYWTIPAGLAPNSSFGNRTMIRYAHVLYSKEWGNYDNARYISPTTSAIFPTGTPPPSSMPWNFSTVWAPLPNETVTDTVWLRIEADTDTIRNNGNEIAWIRPWGTAVPFSIDSSPPTAPSLLAYVKSDTSAKLSWSASADEGCMDLTGYRIYRNDNQITTVTSGILSYVDNNLQPGTTYTYKIVAYDNLNNNVSSNSTSITTTSPTPPSPSPSSGVINPSSPSPSTQTNTQTNTGGSSSQTTTNQTASKANTSSNPAGTTVTAPSASASSVAATLPDKVVRLKRIKVEQHEFVAEDVKDKLEVKKGSLVRLEGVSNPPGSTIIIAVVAKERSERNIIADAEGNWKYDLDTSSINTGTYRILGAIQSPDGTKENDAELMKFSLFTSLPGGVSVLARQQAPKSISLIAYFLVFALVIISIIGLTLLYLKRKNPLSSPVQLGSNDQSVPNPPPQSVEPLPNNDQNQAAPPPLNDQNQEKI